MRYKLSIEIEDFPVESVDGMLNNNQFIIDSERRCVNFVKNSKGARQNTESYYNSLKV